MAVHNPWTTVGWVNVDEYFHRVKVNNYQVLYSDNNFCVVRIPPAAGREAHWHILEWANANPVYRLMWLNQTKWRARMREVVVEKLGKELGNSIIDNIPVPE